MADLQRLIASKEFGSSEDLKSFLGSMVGKTVPEYDHSQSPEDQAQKLVYDARDALTRIQRIKLARQALELSKDCADAYLILATEAGTAEESVRLLREAVAAGERSLGPETMEEDVGHFWGLFETRPYMRARADLAQVCWELGDRTEALDHLRDLLRLNPNDNQGLRYVLIDYLLQSRLDEEAEALLAQYDDEIGAPWAYSEALLLFRRHGSTPAANAALTSAFETNPHVPLFLLRRRRMPKRLPEYVVLGDQSEAVSYVYGAMKAWVQTDGALAWLRQHLGPANSKR